MAASGAHFSAILLTEQQWQWILFLVERRYEARLATNQVPTRETWAISVSSALGCTRASC
jgi:hypothetical protein